MFNYNQPLYNQFQPQLNRLQQLEQQFQPAQQPQNKVVSVISEEVAKNTQIPLDGSTTYFVFGDTILARNWNIAGGCVDNKTFKLENDTNIPKENQPTLNDVLERLDLIEKKLTYPINKKVNKDVE